MNTVEQSNRDVFSPRAHDLSSYRVLAPFNNSVRYRFHFIEWALDLIWKWSDTFIAFVVCLSCWATLCCNFQGSQLDAIEIYFSPSGMFQYDGS